MTSTSFSIYQYATMPVMALNVQRDGVDVNLTTATSVKLYALKQGEAVNVIDGEALTIDNAIGGEVSYHFDVTETAETGTFNAQLEIIYNDGTKERTIQFSYAVLASL